MSESTPDLIDAAFGPFETSPSAIDESRVSRALRDIADRVEGEEQWRRLRAERAAMMFRMISDGPSVWGTAYGPMAVIKDDAGNDAYVPDIRDADAWTIQYWGERSKNAKHQMLRARYADLVWEFSLLAAERKPDVMFARAAIDAYIEASRLTSTFALQPIQYLTRALELALSIGDDERTRLVVDATFVLYDRAASPKQAGTFPFLFDNLYGNRKVSLSEPQRMGIIERLEQVMRTAAAVGTPDYNPISLETAASRLAIHYRKVGKGEEVKRVWRAYGQAIERASQDVRPMLAMSWLQPLIAIYTREGLKEDADRVSRFLTLKQKDIQGEFKQFTADFKVPAEELRKYVDVLTDGGLQNALQMIAGRFVAAATEARTILEAAAQSAPLQALFAIQKVREGHVVATIGSLTDDPEGRLINQLAQNITIQNFFLHAAVARLRERYNPAHDEIAAWICKCGFFDGREELVEQGVAAFLQEDHVKAVHVLIPQIESGLRQMAAVVGIPPKKLLPKTGLMEDKNLSDLLGDEQLRSLLGEDVTLYLRALLNDKRGHNVRNHVSHGIMPAEYFNESISLRVLHVVLLLGALRVRKRPDDDAEA